MTAQPQRVAAIDIGTNSILLLVADVGADSLEVVADEAVITRLGQGVDASGKLDPEAVERSLDAVRAFREQAEDLGASRVALAGTSALRDAENAASFVGPAEQICGVSCRVIPGETEARLSWLSVASDTSLGAQPPLAMADVGGGSTEVVSGVDESILQMASVDTGAVRLTERFLKSDPPSLEELDAARVSARKSLEGVLHRVRASSLAGIGGTIVNLACIAGGGLDHTQAHGRRLSLEDLRGLIHALASERLQERRHTPGLEPQRADIIVSGAIIFEAVLNGLGLQEVITSIRGARFGIAMELAAGRWS